MFFFALKKIATKALMPISLCFLFLLLGVILLWFTRRKRLGKILVTISLVLFFISGYGSFSKWALQPLEYEYPALVKRVDVSNVKWVVVLGGGHAPDLRLPATSQLDLEGLARVVEGIRLHRVIPESRLLLSGGAIFGTIPVAETMKNAAVELGVQEKSIVIESESRDTADEARLIRDMVGQERFILVTSASHMPRSVGLFRKQGMEPIPAPAEYLTKEDPQRRWSLSGFLFPSAGEFVRLQRAIHEHLGFLWAKLRGQI
ncbi:MAG: hypothetical protein C4576_00280 [Desulfobacteraceae bacterium]|nr:MAG: hypothetical protein C4576_00280 [Desulfobacteraceae bacterium]